jgi:trigger factor
MNIQKNIVKQPKSTVDVQINLPWADIEPKWNEVLGRMGQEIELPGFRKGAAPPAMVETQLGRKLEDEVFKVIMPQALIEALQGTNIVPIDYPQYQINSFQKGQNLQFTARITERPTVQVGQYKGIKVQKPDMKPVSEEEVAKVIDELYRRWKVKNPNAGAQAAPQSPPQQPNGGAAAAQGTQGSMSFNQPAGGQIPTPQASVSEGPDDIFAQGVGAQNLEDLKTKIRTDLENEAKYNNELDYEEAILQEVEKITTVDIPEVLIQDELNRMLVSLQRSITERGLLLDEYLKSQNETVESLKNKWRPQAEKNVRMELGLSEIARSEGVNIADEELQSEIDKIQDQRVKQQFTQDEPRMHLRHALRQTKTLNLLKTIVG